MTEQDWLCEVCGTQNSRTDKTCAVCGSPMPAAFAVKDGTKTGTDTAGKKPPAVKPAETGQPIRITNDDPPAVIQPRPERKPFDFRAFAIACTWVVRLLLWGVLGFTVYHWLPESLPSIEKIGDGIVQFGSTVAAVARKVTTLGREISFTWIGELAEKIAGSFGSAPGWMQVYDMVNVLYALLWIPRVLLRKIRTLQRGWGSIIPLVLEMPLFILVHSWYQVVWNTGFADITWRYVASHMLFTATAVMLLTGVILTAWRFRNREAFTGREFRYYSFIQLVQFVFLYLIMC